MDDLGQTIEEEVVVPEAEEAPAPLSIREELGNALAKSKEPKEEEVKVKPDKPRAEDGKFTKEKVSRESKQPVATAVAPAATLPEIKMPRTFAAANAPKWAELSRQQQEFLAKREEDFHKQLTTNDEERIFGRQLREMAAPYTPIIAAENGDIKTAFSQFLNTAYQLRTATPQMKGQLLMQLAQKFGADMRGASQAQPQVDPQLQGLQQQVQSLQQKIEKEAAFKKQQEDESIQAQIKAFSDDPKNIHFSEVKAHMAALLKSGIAGDLQEAYDQAVYANPHTRSTLLQQQSSSVEEKRVADKKAKADAAKRAGSSIKGAPGMAASKNGQIVQKDLRSELKAQFAAYRDG